MFIITICITVMVTLSLFYFIYHEMIQARVRQRMQIISPNVKILDGFNKTIFTLWFQGFENAPKIVKLCVHSWKVHNPTWNVVLLDNSTLNNYIDASQLQRDIPNRATMIPNHVADIIRMILLDRYGGVWADATLFCNRPLDDWIYGNITQGFFGFRRPTPTRMLSNWFLYGSRKNYIIRKWLNATVTYHAAHPTTDVYFIHHKLFQSLYMEDSVFKAIWDKVPDVPADGPHLLDHRGFYKNLSEEVRFAIDSNIFPVYKLSWKAVTRIENITNIQYLLFTRGKIM